jgi:redox-sensitive bicupin YhaK (pirin superfamily)
MSTLMPLIPHSKDLGDGVVIERYLPHLPRPKVGPFVFFDYLPQIQFEAGIGTDVRPHPHIGLSTLSYLFHGRMHHKDSLGYDIILAPGDVLLMSSGKGIVHSERTPQEDRLQPHSIHMVQFWLALPQSHEEMEPKVGHATQPDLPFWQVQEGLSARLAIGTALGQKAPVSSLLNPFLVDFEASTGGNYTLESDERESAFFLISGSLNVNGETFSEPAFVVLESDQTFDIKYPSGSRFLWLGGDPLDGHRIVWWNLVASRPELIEAAKERWRKGEFAMVAGDEEFIPLPES